MKISKTNLSSKHVRRSTNRIKTNMLKVCNFNLLHLRLYSRASRKVVEDVQEKVVKVAVIGLPNTGKSTLINTILDQRVSEKNFLLIY